MKVLLNYNKIDALVASFWIVAMFQFTFGKKRTIKGLIHWEKLAKEIT